MISSASIFDDFQISPLKKDAWILSWFTSERNWKPCSKGSWNPIVKVSVLDHVK